MLFLFFVACSVEKTGSGLAVLGFQDEIDDTVSLEKILDASAGLNRPRDLAFNPDSIGQLWVVNHDDDSVVIVDEAGGSAQSSQHLIDPFALHFMEKVSSISFGKTESFATCQESRNTYNDTYEGDNFMGPTLWTSDLSIFGKSNPEAVDYLSDAFGMPTDLGSHLDMNHETPLCMGIAWERDNVYWAFDGSDGSIDRNDFAKDHGPGYDDHSDGVITRYAAGQFKRKSGVPSHMIIDTATDLLYIADTGNSAIKTLDIHSGETGGWLDVKEPGVTHYEILNADVETLIDGQNHDLSAPSGLSIIDDVLFVTDNDTGIIHAFDLNGNPLDRYDTGLGEGALMGIYASSIDDLWFVDAQGDALYRLQPDMAEGGRVGAAGEYEGMISN